MPTAAMQAQDNRFSLFARPSICVSYDSEADCAMTMALNWESTFRADVCLRQEQASTLKCWDDAIAGQLELEYADTRNVSYYLVDAATDEQLAETEVVVINRDLRNSRQRRRHVWNIL